MSISKLSFHMLCVNLSQMCVIYQECKNKLLSNPNDQCKPVFEVHKRKAQKRKEMRDDYIKKSKNENASYLVLGFDYSQNFPIPKLNVNTQFYKRIFWLYCFNIHVFNDDSSYCYTFTECDGRKNPNSVVSFLYDCLQKQINKFSTTKTVVLLSDATGGQNRNVTVTRFASWFAKVFEVSVIQLFPVRGHSFSQCDRNFGVINKAIKNAKVIGNPKPYLVAMVTCRSNPQHFEVIMDSSHLQDWDLFLKQFVLPKPLSKNKIPFKIMKYVLMKFDTEGGISCSQSYTQNYQLFRFWKQGVQDYQTVKTTKSPRPEINPKKVEDVTSLFRFLNKEDVDFIQNEMLAKKVVTQ